MTLTKEHKKFLNNLAYLEYTKIPSSILTQEYKTLDKVYKRIVSLIKNDFVKTDVIPSESPDYTYIGLTMKGYEYTNF